MKLPLSDYRILVLEDEFLVLMMIEGMLADSGFRHVETATTVTKALALLSAQQFDAAMIDLNLRGENSYDVADQLVAKRIPFFFCTGNSASDMSEEYRSHPALRKPFDERGLAKIFSQILQ
jgi:CheY-like chemotaxis protein